MQDLHEEVAEPNGGPISADAHLPDWVPQIVCELYAGWRAVAKGDEDGLGAMLATLERVVTDNRCKLAWEWLAQNVEAPADLSDLCIEIMRFEQRWAMRRDKDDIQEHVRGLQEADRVLGPIRGAQALAADIEAEIGELVKAVPRQTQHAKATLLVRTLDRFFIKGSRLENRADGYYSRLSELAEVVSNDVMDANEVRKAIQRFEV